MRIPNTFFRLSPVNFLLSTLAACCLLLLVCCSPPEQHIPLPASYTVLFSEPPRHTPSGRNPDAPLAGNGDIGIAMGGPADSLTFYIGKNDFWRAYSVYPGGGIASPGGFDLHIGALAGGTYHAEQDPGKAVIRGRFTNNELTVEMTAWVAATANKIIIELSADRDCEVRTRLWATEGNTSVTEKGFRDKAAWVTRSFENTPLLEWPCRIALAAGIPEDGIIALQKGVKQVIVIAAYTDQERPDWKEAAIGGATVDQASLKTIRQEHDRWWRDYWQKSNISIGDEWLEKYYYTSQYLIGCSSREGKFAPGIWGPFVTQDFTWWGGDYHLNYNYQAPYWALFSSNRIAQTDNFHQPILDYMEQGRLHARQLLGCNGIYYPVGIGPKGVCTTRWPLTPEEMLRRYGTLENTIDSGYKFLGQKINAVFSVGNMLMRFYSTYDETYARKVYPYLLACADFWEDYLSYEDGRYVIRMDHFNEIMPNLRNNGIWRPRLGDLNSTLSLGLVRMLFLGTVEMSEFLESDGHRREKWRHILEHLSDYPTGTAPDGRRSLKNMELGPGGTEVPANGLNRVSIHGLVLPGGVCGPVTDPSFNEILREDVAHWIDRKQEPGGWGNTLGNGIETCFPGAVRVGYDPQVILRELQERIEAQSYANCWIVQNGGGIETLAAVPLTLHEMLMQSYEHVVRVFPVWPRNKDASFENLRAYGAFLVSSRIEGEDIAYVRIESEKGRILNLENPWPGKEVSVSRNGRKAGTVSGDRLEIPTSPGEKLELNPVNG